jgi:hypothetical protein
MKRALVVVVFLALGLPVNAAADQAQLESTVEDVPAATAHRYAARDNVGNSLDTLKIINNPQGGYLGVYHTLVSGTFYVKLATSNDLLAWTFRADLARNASQPTISRLVGGSFLLAYEQDVGCTGVGVGGSCLRFLHYPNVGALLGHSPDRSFQAPRTISSCAEGTPNIYWANLDPDLEHSTIKVGFHYFRACDVDRQAAGFLANFSSWKTWVAGFPNDVVQALGAAGDIGDRDSMPFDGIGYRLVEGQLAKGDFGSWRTFLFSWPTGAKRLNVHTHGGSTAFANPTFTPVRAPTGGTAIVVTMFLPREGAAPGEAGELIYYRKLDTASEPPPSGAPTVRAAGDIACSSSPCQAQRDTAALLPPATAVLTLGDNQYASGGQSDYLGSYDPTWGVYKAKTRPSPGNHDPCSSYYGTYFAQPNCRFSFALGTWHLISLDSNNVSASNTFLQSDLAAHPAQCTLAYWHHPRFSSGSRHGNNSGMDPLWRSLYAARADVVLNGHDHEYERFAPQNPSGVADPNGIREFVVGTGGRSLYSFSSPVPNSQLRDASHYGVLELTLHPSSYDWRFIARGGTVTDSGTGQCV